MTDKKKICAYCEEEVEGVFWLELKKIRRKSGTAWTLYFCSPYHHGLFDLSGYVFMKGVDDVR